MAENFDPKLEAQTVEHIGNLYCHGFTGDSSMFSEFLGRLGELNPEQTKQVGNQLWWDNLKPTGAPSAEMSVGEDGHITDFVFKPAWINGGQTDSCYTHISTGHHDTGKPGD